MRIATYNCENLFSRPRIFGESQAKALRLLDYLAQLETELRKEEFDHARIAELEKKLAGYAKVNDIRGKHKSAQGARAWLGWVELARDRLDDTAVQNTARVIADLRADIVCLIEIEDRLALQRFHDKILYEKFLQPARLPRYERVLLIDGNDPRGIDVALLARLPVTAIRTHIHERTTYLGKDVPLFSRDCLEVDLQLPNRKRLHLLVNHFKSMGYGDKRDPQSNQRRLEQAARVAELVDAYDLKKDFVVVAGDLNSPPTSPSLAPLVNKRGLYNTVLQLPASERSTYHDGKQQIDYLLVSDALKKRLTRVHIERRGIYSRKWAHYDTVTDQTSEASDHAAVVGEFNLG